MLRTSLLVALLLLAGCVLVRRPAEPLAESTGNSNFIREQLIVHCDFDLPRQHRLLDEVTALRGDIASKLGLAASDEPIHVYLFEKPEAYNEFALKYFRHSQPRRAFFVETDTRLNVYAQWGDNVAEDLRHETAHGYLHATVRNVPLWLDEGLAEYFEVPRGRQGRNQPHLDLLAARLGTGEWSPDMARLEQLTSAADMTQQDYAEAWLWVHMLLESSPDRRVVLTEYLGELRRSGIPAPLSLRLRELEPNPHRSLAEHLQAIRPSSSIAQRP
jgi:hypothetical protein